ncbi:adenine phosphoribosyltransferase [Minwuia thermotolerans]|uniref:Adenine phosphoribosyltransferase n=1 Tax=Minwuia thermotolerans TaxID=2056226 RepID=A0A2M9G0C9_9PROT|nr:adenine phosphoribosyltransferase [Minwuia thermotolerans]PJK29134.1 adenine phosphoribosyltransferase [Minwuia thermotolerans]
MALDDIRDLIRTIPDYPKPGIMFRDVTTLWANARGFRTAIDRLVQPYAGVRIDKVAGIEARGFVLGGAVAHQLSVGFVPVCKKGKLPWDTIAEHYELEYGTDTIEIHTDAIREGENILIVDDLLATGGTAAGAVNLVRKAGGTVVGCCFIVDLPDLGGKAKLHEMGLSVMTLCEFEGD